MEHLHFLSDTVEPRKTITNFESLEHPLSRSDTSPTSLETFQSEEYMYNIQEEFQDNMWDNIRQTEQTDFCSPHLLNMPSRPSNSASPRPNNTLSRSNSALIRLDSISPRPNSASPRPNSASPRPHYASSRPNSAFPRPDSVSSRPQTSHRMSSHSQNQPTASKCAKRTKRQLSETGIDAVDEAILNLVGKQNSADTMNSDDLFYLSISRDSQQLKRKITLKDTCTTSTFSSYNRGTK
ncbi:uncharacterized protein LOC112588440 isoform X1 [Harpegnathos saltator]|uniref:uncharacterized protein LOC105180512 isoform X1 n=1 Tax=Harpegnathos saltator TaxID=610380 RepID=UPI000DBEECD9|nr:uncharacterized protein LOC105180512 isoform X1 [Harpegnathos saltator]XP_025154193.1 uncharacterized protein LOC112588440 isoform X1 [Harpegnathos saltator]